MSLDVVVLGRHGPRTLSEVDMPVKMNKILVVDVEATCWEPRPAPPGQESEIIEIGICRMDVVTGERERESIMVRPERSTISDFCTSLTGITQEEVDRGVLFAEACLMLQDRYGSRTRVWASYGDYDRLQFEKECREHGVAYPFGRTHLNVKALVALARKTYQMGLADALEARGRAFEGRHHRGVDDAWNIAGILWDTLHPV